MKIPLSTTEIVSKQNIADSNCDPHDTALKTFFLGPRAENAEIVSDYVNAIFQDWYGWRKGFYKKDGNAISKSDQNLDEFRYHQNIFRQNLDTILARFHEEIPTFSPRYIGHMITEISLPALFGHIITLLHNPNNITGEASRVGTLIEDEAIADLATMLGYNAETSSGHFTSGGTVANFEAVLRARSRMTTWISMGALARTQGRNISLFESAHMGWETYDRLKNELKADASMLKPYHLLANNPFEVAAKLSDIFQIKYRGPVIIVPESKHYSWEKAVELTGLGKESFWPVALDSKSKMDVDDLKKTIEKARMQQRPILMIVSVAGTTELGDFDPIDRINALKESYKEANLFLWHHVDAAYGGFFCSLLRSDEAVDENSFHCALSAIKDANSITVDPHKLGYVPYASGTFLCKNRREYYSGSIKAPYIDFNASKDKGPQTIEGSRSAAGAVSTWLTSKTIGLNANGYGRILQRTISAKEEMEELLRHAHPHIRVAPHLDTNICCFSIAKNYEPTSISNQKTLDVFNNYSAGKNGEFFVSKTTLTSESYRKYLIEFVDSWHGQLNTEGVTLIRLTLMNPFLQSKESNIDYIEAFVKNLTAFLKKQGD